MNDQNNNMENDSGEPMNALPEYKIRTMKDDLSGTSPAPISPVEPIAPINLPITKEESIEFKPEIRKAPLPSIEELAIEAPPKPSAPVKPPLPILPPPAQKIEAAPIYRGEPSPRGEASHPEASGREKRGKSKFFIILIIIIIIAIAIAAFFYWQGTKPEPAPNQSPQNEEPQTPQSLIPVEKTKIISIKNNIPLPTYLINQTKLEQAAGTFKSIIPQKEDKKLSLNELTGELGIVIYPYVLSELKDNYSLFLYGQDNKKRLGLIIEINNPDTIKEQLRFWEITMVDDMKNLFLEDKPGNPITKTFQDNIYNGISIRYINFPNPDLTIDYAIKNNLLILCTSKELMYKIIDRIE